MAVVYSKSSPSPLKLVGKYSDLLVVVTTILIIGMMVMPMPEWALDILLTLNIALGLTVLLVTIYTTKPLEFSSFPAFLLISTLFRLGLNISATRLVLLNASAGQVATAFGTVVVGGNYIVGAVVFLILVIVQFMVITNGTGRVSEVAARFTLDAMPGKQMSIDADLNAGSIDEEEAKRRREEITREADFYGSMDGASKFIRGDASAGIIMMIVNILGGFVVGVVQKHMDFMSALQNYTLLTIGIGLVTQIPSLLISTSAGLMVTKTTSDNNLGSDVAIQMLNQPKALLIAGGICGLLLIVPGVPKVPFGLIAAGFIGMYKLLNKQPSSKMGEPETVVQGPKAPEDMTGLLSVDPLEVELGYGLISLADPKQGGDLLDRITAVRRQIAIDLGLLVPAIRVRDNMQLKPNTYTVKIRGVEITRGELYIGHILAMNPGTAMGDLKGIETTEPAFGLPATWISELQQSEAEMSGYTVVDAPTVMITHVTEILRKHAAEILTRQDIQTLIDTVREVSPAVVEELIPNLLTLGDVQKVLQNLLSERVSIRDLTTILEALTDAARLVKDPDLITEFVRQALCRQITAQYQSVDGMVRVFTLDPSIEQILSEGIRQTEGGYQLVLEPGLAQKLLEGTRAQIEDMAAMGYQPVALCSPRIRAHFRRLVERMMSTLAVISYHEIAPGVGLETVGMVTLANEDVENQSLVYA